MMGDHGPHELPVAHERLRPHSPQPEKEQKSEQAVEQERGDERNGAWSVLVGTVRRRLVHLSSCVRGLGGGPPARAAGVHDDRRMVPRATRRIR